MKHIHQDIAGKPFDYVHLDKAFLSFAKKQCGGRPAEELLQSLEETIATEHSRAQTRPYERHPYTVWELDTEHLVALYQIRPDHILIGPIWSKSTGAFY